MPELPEVQTIVDDLSKKIKGDVIVDFWSDWPKSIKGLSLGRFKKEIKNRKILSIRRIGKNIFIDLSGKKTLYIHLKMTGHLLVKTRANFQFPISNFQKNSNNKNLKIKKRDYFNDRVNQYIHHIFYLKPQTPNLKSQTNSKFKILNSKFYNKTLEFSDLRKFGKIVLDNTEKINNLSEIKNLGIDVMSKEFTLEKLINILSRKKNISIGAILLDQSFLSGIGNIYRSEILYDAGILPQKKLKEISLKEVKKIFLAIRKILKKAIKFRGTSDSDYRDTSGAPGDFQKILKVYRRAEQKCKKCGMLIMRIKIGQRSAFYCPQCQK